MTAFTQIQTQHMESEDKIDLVEYNILMLRVVLSEIKDPVKED
jgi:hypothetical protein